MITTHTDSQAYFSSLLSLGQTVLGCTEAALEHLFFTNEQCAMAYKYGRERSRLLEVQLDGATLVCMLGNGTGLCELSILYFDTAEDIADYVRLCDGRYAYCARERVWATPKGVLKLKQAADTGQRIAFVQGVRKENVQNVLTMYR